MPLCRFSAGLGLLLCSLALASSPVLAQPGEWDSAPYRLGQGLNFPQQRLIIGGYLNLHAADLQRQDWRVGVRDLSLFISKAIHDRWQFFSEIELGDIVEVSPDGVSGRHSELDLERLYLDYHESRVINFRIGKFLTPVGRWNLIHADPLVWTPDRPLTTAAAFARHATGAMFYGDLAIGSNSLEYSLFADYSELLDSTREKELAFEDDDSGLSPRNAFQRALGARAVYHFADDNAQLGVSYLRSRMEDLEERKELIGADLLWTFRRMEFSGEWVYRNSLGPVEPDEYGGFMQAVLPLSERFYLVGRHERYRAAFLETTATIDSAGITYRPHEAVSLKLEYRTGDDNGVIAPSGWLGSLAILF